MSVIRGLYGIRRGFLEGLWIRFSASALSPSPRSGSRCRSLVLEVHLLVDFKVLHDPVNDTGFAIESW